MSCVIYSPRELRRTFQLLHIISNNPICKILKYIRIRTIITESRFDRFKVEAKWRQNQVNDGTHNFAIDWKNRISGCNAKKPIIRYFKIICINSLHASCNSQIRSVGRIKSIKQMKCCFFFTLQSIYSSSVRFNVILLTQGAKCSHSTFLKGSGKKKSMQFVVMTGSELMVNYGRTAPVLLVLCGTGCHRQCLEVRLNEKKRKLCYPQGKTCEKT